MSFTAKFTPKAEETYDALVAQLRQRWGEKFVVKFENKLSKAIQLISVLPYSYPITEKNLDPKMCSA